MSETKEETKGKDDKTPLSLRHPGTLEIKKTVAGGQVRQSFSHGRSKVVAVEVRKKRSYALDSGGQMAEVTPGAEALDAQNAAAFDADAAETGTAARTSGATLDDGGKSGPRPRPRGRAEGGRSGTGGGTRGERGRRRGKSPPDRRGRSAARDRRRGAPPGRGGGGAPRGRRGGASARGTGQGRGGGGGGQAQGRRGRGRRGAAEGPLSGPGRARAGRHRRRAAANRGGARES